MAQELGISSMPLRTWRDAFLAKLAANLSISAGVDPISLAAELRKVQRENEYLRRQREILKKSDEHTLCGPAQRNALIRLHIGSKGGRAQNSSDPFDIGYLQTNRNQRSRLS